MENDEIVVIAALLEQMGLHTVATAVAQADDRRAVPVLIGDGKDLSGKKAVPTVTFLLGQALTDGFVQPFHGDTGAGTGKGDAADGGAEAQNALGVVLLENGNLDEARGRLDTAIALKPEEGRFYYNRAEVKKQQKQFAEAVEDAGRAVVFAPDMAAAWVNRGELRFLLEDDENACLDLERACDLGLCERLEVYQKSGRCLTGFGS